MNSMQDELIKTVAKLLKDHTVDLFIGYEQGTLPLQTSPCFLTAEEDAKRLVWNSLCANNLAVYLPRLMPDRSNARYKRIGVLCKGCDSRSVAGLIKEKQVARDRVFVLGIACPGIVDKKKIAGLMKGTEIDGVEETADEIIVNTRDSSRCFKKKELLYECCADCTHPSPLLHDAFIGKENAAPRAPQADARVREFSSKERAGRWKVFEAELSRCIRCYACRNACPNCYCRECFAEETKPAWIGVTDDLSDIMFYHMGRILHQAGRCVDCGACVRACPMDIDLRLFTRVLVDEVQERFGYEPGLSLEESAPLATYRAEDKQEFMTEPE
ncbi:4Fe-4S binding protein [candidate division WOR-3 bacterium]|nr:4Fe-4S binding protein [candidate division WOR-3 bacterium]